MTFQAALANSSSQANANDGGVSGSPKAHSNAATPDRTASKQDKSQAASNNDTLATIPLVDPQAAAPKDPSTGGENGVPAATAGPQFTDAVPSLHSRMSAVQPAAGTEECAALPQLDEPAAAPRPAPASQQSNPTPTDKAVDAAHQADAQSAAAATAQPSTGIPPQATAASSASQALAETLKLQIVLPMTSPLAKAGDSIQSSSKPAQKNSIDTAGSKVSDTSTSSNAKPADAVGATSDASSRGTQSDGQSPQQHSQTDVSQATAAAMAKPVDSGASQAQPVPTQVASHQPVPAAGAGLADGSHANLDRAETPPSPLDGDEVTPTSGINTARVMQTINQTEMRVGMQSAEFGSISIRTSVSQQQMLAQITLDRGDLSQAIAAHIPAMQARLGADYGLHTTIQVSHQGTSSSGGQGSSQREQRSFTPSARFESAATPAELDVGIGIGIGIGAAQLGTGEGYRLDIRA
jgi:hypothetical protein